jgi:unsaturated chondroitin disaccharide hydrolase
VAGQLWQVARAADDPGPLKSAADLCTRALAVRADDRITHDVGFLFWPSAVLGAEATRNQDYVVIGRRAALSLLSRRHPTGLIQAWGNLNDPRARGSSTIDTMMNLPLLWWADRNGVAGARDAAIEHARISARLYIRPDGTTFHVARIAEDGSPVERGTFQGYASNSCWSRGQAWAVHGFIDAYRATGDRQFKEAAETVIQAFLERLPEDDIAPWDFDDPDWRDAPRDASATAIVAAGLLKLARFERSMDSRADEGQTWLAVGTRLLHSLIANAANRCREDGILLKCTYSYPHRSGVSGAVTWGDYFFIECLVLLTFPDRFIDPVAGNGAEFESLDNH